MDTITTLIIEPGKTPHAASIPDTLEAMQAIVGGYIEPLHLWDGTTIYCNEEGTPLHLPANRTITRGDLDGTGDETPIAILSGTFLITGENGLDATRTARWAERFAL